MRFTPPPVADIKVAFPEIVDLSLYRQGGFKAVYRSQTSSGIEAFKLLCLPRVPDDALDKDAQKEGRREHLARALREVDLLRKIRIPEVVKLGSISARIADVGGLECLGYSEEWLEGDNIWDYSRATANLPKEDECRQLLKCLISAISALWALETVHRDIKPQNVMRLDSTTRPFVLLDLGIAYDLSEPGLTYNTALVPCTYRYIAPEMTENKFRERLDFRCDLYAAGLTIYEFAARRHPFAHDADDLVKTISRALREIPPSLRVRRPDFSEEFCDLIDQFLKKKPMLRPGNLDMLIRRVNSLQ